jgi:heat shock protein HtpX
MLNVYEQVERNKRRSAIVVFSFVLFVFSFIWLVGKVLGSSSEIIIIATAFSLASAFTGYFWGDKMVLAISGAKPASKEKYFDFFTVTENLSIAAQIPLPKLYVIESPAMNAFATGRNPDHAVVCATTGLLKRLNRSELEAVIAHEVSHIIDYDMRLMTVVAVFVGMITLISDWFLRWSFFSSRDNDRRSVNPIVVVIGLISLILAPIIAKIIQLAISRRREYLADASAVKLTRQPQALISALRKLASDPIPLSQARPATAHLYITNPLKKKGGKFRKLASLFSTHPPIEERIAALEKML